MVDCFGWTMWKNVAFPQQPIAQNWLSRRPTQTHTKFWKNVFFFFFIRQRKRKTKKHLLIDKKYESEESVPFFPSLLTLQCHFERSRRNPVQAFCSWKVNSARPCCCCCRWWWCPCCFSFSSSSCCCCCLTPINAYSPECFCEPRCWSDMERPAVNQSIDQSINQSINQLTSQLVNYPNNIMI